MKRFYIFIFILFLYSFYFIIYFFHAAKRLGERRKQNAHTHTHNHAHTMGDGTPEYGRQTTDKRYQQEDTNVAGWPVQCDTLGSEERIEEGVAVKRGG